MAAVIALATGCAHLSTSFTCPAKGGVPWREVRSEHFVVTTDLGSRGAQELTRELEMLHLALRSALFGTPPAMPGTIRVVVFRTRDEFLGFAPASLAAFFGTLHGEPLVVLDGALPYGVRTTLAHELTHYMAARAFARQPRWFAEGMAAYMETVGSSGLGNTPTVGGVPRHYHALVYPYFGKVREVLTARGALELPQYAVSWALVHYLINVHPVEFNALQARFVRGDDPDVAWRDVFPQWDPAVPGATDALDAELGSHVARGRFRYRDLHLVKDHPVRERPMLPAEVHDVRLSLASAMRWPPEKLDAEVTEALAEDPGNVVALTVAARSRGAEPAALARKATEAHADDARAWLFLGDVLPESDVSGREAALRRAVAAAPENPEPLNALAWNLLRSGRPGEALPLAKKAFVAAPWDPAIVDTVAGVLAGLGDCGEAVRMQQRAIDLLPDRMKPRDRQDYIDHLAEFQRCAAKAATPDGVKSAPLVH
ncbi:hypothetical protein [Anaeromyxobacter sp. SG66]|nr:hypothetical protein [Anaeromyxobacter sp. SG66]